MIEQVKAIFARQAIPEVVVSDNGPQFNSRVFVSFSENYRFTHLTSSPLHPQGSWACRADGEEAVEESRRSLRRSSELPCHATSTRVQPCRAVDGKKTQDQGTDTTNSTCSWREAREQVPGNWCSPETAAKDRLWSASWSPTSSPTDWWTTSLGQDSRRRRSCSGGTIVNRLHSIVQRPDGERHPKKGPTSSPSQRSTIFIRLRWGTQANIHHHTESVVTANRSVWRPVWCSARCPAPGGKWWMCSTPVLGAASRYPKDLIFKTYISTWTIMAKRQMSWPYYKLHFVSTRWSRSAVSFWTRSYFCFKLIVSTFNSRHISLSKGDVV